METQSAHNSYDPQFVRNMVESFLRIGLLSLLLIWSFDIVRPFVVPIVWGSVIAIAVFPLVRWLQPKVGNRRGLAASIVTTVFILLLVVPTWQVTDALVGSVQKLSVKLQAGEVHIPPPPAGVAEWPVVGERVFETWSQASQDLRAVVDRAGPQLEEVLKKLLRRMGSTIMGVLMFVVALIIAGGFMTYAESCGDAAHRIFVRIGGLKPGGEWAPLTVATVRNVLKGVVGVAIIQTLLCVTGLAVMGIPGTPIWSVVILFLAIAQLPPLIIVAPIIGYAFSAYGTTPAVIFTLWMLVASSSDTFLKPLLMGRGLDIPMPVILLGAIGGMITTGIVGLFAGAVVLSIWYKLFKEWMAEDSPVPSQGNTGQSGAAG